MAEELGIAIDRGTITSPIAAGGNTLCDSNKQWGSDIFRNVLVRVTAPTGQREFGVVNNNVSNVLVIRGSWVSAFPIGSSYEILAFIDLGRIIPLAKAAIFNTALPAANTNLLGTEITPTNSPSWLRIYVTIAVAGRLYLRRTVSGVTVSEDLNSGANLVANSAYCFGPIEWRTGDSLNLRYSATGGNILVLRIDEIGAAE